MILIALGANLPSRYGSAEETLCAAMKAMQTRGLSITACSRIWLTAPVPKSDQPFYRNAVAQVETALTAHTVLETLHEIEAEFGRVRSVRNAPRCLDLDLLAYHDMILTEDEGLSLPHPRMHERAFVLGPLCDIAPDWTHPVLQKTAREIYGALPADHMASPAEELAA